MFNLHQLLFPNYSLHENLFYYIYSVQLLLGYLPTDRSLWAYELEKKRSQYSAYKEEFLLNPVSFSC